jgi:tripartite-type tricarboxylate transporter receptor subunit TctC
VAGIDLVHVPYKGAGPQLVDVISGNVAMGFVSLTAAIPHVRAGKLKILMVTGQQRSSAMPDVPTATEAGIARGRHRPPAGWNPGAGAHAASRRLPAQHGNRAGNPCARRSGALHRQGLTPVASTADEFLALIKSDLVRWPKIIKEAGNARRVVMRRRK